MKKHIKILLSSFAFILSGCMMPLTPTGTGEDTGGGTEQETTTHVSGITLSENTLSLEEGSTKQLTYVINPSNATNKNVTWESSNSTIASVENGLVSAWNEGTAVITLTALDGNKTDTCTVTVTKAQPVQQEIKVDLDLNEQGYTESSKSLTNVTLSAENEYEITFAVGANTRNNQPTLIKSGKVYEARIYWGNTFTVTSKTVEMTKIEFAFTDNDKGNSTTASTGSLAGNTWTGSSKSVTFSVSGSDGYRAISCFSFIHLGEITEDPDSIVNLGTMSIAEVKQYISEHPVKKNAFGNGVNQNRYVTIKGLALAKIDLVKEKSEYGLNVSNPAKVIVGDETGWIGCACKTGQGSLWYKIDDYVAKSTSKYTVTGYISEYLDHPEIQVTSYMWDKNMTLDVDISRYASEISLSGFYTNAKAVNYNCAGHGYGDVYTIKGLTCYYSEADGSGKRYYNFTDGTQSIRVNAFNVDGATVGNCYDVTGIISLKNYSPIIVAFSIKTSQSSAIDFDYDSASTSISIENLRKIHGSQDDTNQKYPELIECFGTFYKTTGYLVVVEEGYKYYIGISDTYINRVISGKTNAMANYNIALIKNDGFWNTTEEKLALFNSYYQDYIFEDNAIDVYYTPRQLEYSSNKACWEVLLVPSSIPEMVKE